jgi:hypothetical protein
MRSDIWIIVDQTPGFTSGQNKYSDPSLVGWNFYIEYRSVGSLNPQTEVIINSDGFEMRNGITFQSNDEYVIHFNGQLGIANVQSNYTNAFDKSLVLPALRNRIGWRQPTISGAPVLNTFNKTSLSGRVFQSFHASCSPINIKAANEDSNISDDDFNQLLSDLQDDAILKLLNEVFRNNGLIEQKLLYTRFGQMDLIIQNSSMFVGYIIDIANDFGISTQINNCTLYFDGTCDFNLYLFQDGIKQPIQIIPVHCDAYQRNTIQIDNLYLTYKTGRKFYLGYFQDELNGVHAIQEQVDVWATTRCYEAIAFAAPRITNQFDFNHNMRQYTALPRGLNLEMISFRDHTQQIVRKANLFDEGIGLTVAAMAIEMMMNSTSSNFTQRITQENVKGLYSDLNQAYATDTFPITAGLKSKLISETKMLTASFFPKVMADSVNMGSTRDQYNDMWERMNIKMLTNPPMMKQ